MATKYDIVYSWFLHKVTDYDLPAFTDIEKEYVLLGYLKSACVKFSSCKINLFDRDDTLKQFNQTLDDEILDILSENMIISWLQPRLNNTENLKNALSTKDFNLYSPANLLKELRETFKEINSNARKMISNYSFRHANPKDLIK